jgi:hypothetical protein
MKLLHIRVVFQDKSRNISIILHFLTFRYRPYLYFCRPDYMRLLSYKLWF